MSPVDWVCKRISFESASAQLSAITIIACVASVSNRVIAQKLERKRKKPSFPSPSPVITFLLSSQLSRRTRAETLATQAITIKCFPAILTHAQTLPIAVLSTLFSLLKIIIHNYLLLKQLDSRGKFADIWVSNCCYLNNRNEL